jgi:hypothetical protein
MSIFFSPFIIFFCKKIAILFYSNIQDKGKRESPTSRLKIAYIAYRRNCLQCLPVPAKKTAGRPTADRSTMPTMKRQHTQEYKFLDRISLFSYNLEKRIFRNES